MMAHVPKKVRIMLGDNDEWYEVYDAGTDNVPIDLTSAEDDEDFYETSTTRKDDSTDEQVEGDDDDIGLAFDDEDDDEETLVVEHDRHYKGKGRTESDIKPYQSMFKVYSTSDITAKLENEINMLVELSLPHDVCRPLLHNTAWNVEKVCELYADQSKKWKELLKKAALAELGDLSECASLLEMKKELWPASFSCGICGDDEPPTPESNVFSLVACGHQFCEQCFGEYVRRKIADREIQFGCPGCNKIVISDSAIEVIAPHSASKFNEWKIQSYVEGKKSLRQCPAPDCSMVIQFNGMGSAAIDPLLQMPKVTCSCGNSFCFLCDHVTDHQPISCALLKKWIKRCKDDSETAKWITANTKDCLKCNTAIEKNGGCHRMQCWKCHFQFCWNCYKEWHGYDKMCNKFDIDQHSSGQSAADQSRAALKRYLHYHTRFTNDLKSIELTAQTYEKVEVSMLKLQNETSLSYIQVQFLRAAVEVLLTCRKTLAYTYVCVFYMKRETPLQENQAQLFEDNQSDLASAVEKLTDLVEHAGEDGGSWEGANLEKKKIEVLDLTSYCKSRLDILLTDFVEALADNRYEFNELT